MKWTEKLTHASRKGGIFLFPHGYRLSAQKPCVLSSERRWNSAGREGRRGAGARGARAGEQLSVYIDSTPHAVHSLVTSQTPRSAHVAANVMLLTLDD
ncbi:unnamed protein product [Leptosia nina]|uniref:Uncharacterized protein n=1 Tax=Leptosia nina TaxID=320188 RepID=A0AAV1JUC5_9NEOP